MLQQLAERCRRRNLLNNFRTIIIMNVNIDPSFFLYPGVQVVAKLKSYPEVSRKLIATVI